VRQINNLEMASGLDIDIGRIEGSIYGGMVIHDLTLKDSKGIFFQAPRADLDWRPFAYFRNHVDIRSLVIPQARLRRLPELRQTGDPNAPMLPDLDIDIGRLKVARLLIDPPVTGQRHLLSLDGNARIFDRRAQVSLAAGALTGPGVAGGDRMAIRLDAVPDDNRFDLSARVQAPANGFVASMTNIPQPIVAQVAGRGSWTNWQGRAQAMLGGRPFANLAVGGRDGTFTVTGPVQPLLLVPASFRKLVAPMVQVNLVTTLAERRADMRLRLNSGALAVAAQGMLDLGQSRYDNFKVAARLLQPGAIAPNLRGRDVRVALVMNGGFGTPVVAYELNAAALGFNETTIEGLRAIGRARIDTDRIVVPISARARRITGVNEAVGGLLTNVAIDGDLAIAGTRLLSDNLRIRSDRINATAVIAADMARGQYRAGLQGRINNYLVRGIGLLDIDSNLDVVTQGDGFGIRGRVAVRTRRIDNASAREFLGGNAIVTANINMDPAGVIRFDRLRVAAPQLRISSGEGTYSPDGRINMRLAGVSTAYGPLAVVITGTATQPQIRIRAARPGFGLANIDADIRATARGYEIRATGQSQYGPFSADLLVVTGRGPLTLEIRRLLFAGITFSGRVVQTGAGPFAGTLAMNGSGLNGTIRLSAAGSVQRADISARANGAQIPGNPPITIQRGIIQATAILYPDAPSIVGDVQVAGARRGDLLVQLARAEDQLSRRARHGAGAGAGDQRRSVPHRVQHRVDAHANPGGGARQCEPHRLPPGPSRRHPESRQCLAAQPDHHRAAPGQCSRRGPVRRGGADDPVAAGRARSRHLQRLLAGPRSRRPRHRQPRFCPADRLRLPARRCPHQHRQFHAHRGCLRFRSREHRYAWRLASGRREPCRRDPPPGRGDRPSAGAAAAGRRRRQLDGAPASGSARRRHPLQRPGAGPVVADGHRRPAAFGPDRRRRRL
jgi:translocation and assembly module TamB